MSLNSNRWTVAGSALALGVLVVAVFAPVLGYDFVAWDDDINVLNNPMLTEPWSWELGSRFFDVQAALRFKPLHWLLFRGLAEVAGFAPAAWHAVGLVLHACTAAAVFLVFREVSRLLAKEAGERADGWSDVWAWLAAALWALHPLRVEPVAWVTASTYPMTGLFLATSFWAYLKARGRAANRGWFICAWLFAVAAYATYPISVTYGLWLMAADYCVLRSGPRDASRLVRGDVARWWAKHLCFLAPAGVAVGLTLWTRFHAPGAWGEAPGLRQFGWEERLLAGWATLSAFGAKLVWPADLTPNQPRLAQTVWVTPWVLSFTLVSSAFAVGLWAARRKIPALGIWALGFTGVALPCLGLTEVATWPVDRYSYVLDIVLIGFLMAGGARVASARAVRLVAMGAFIGGLGAALLASVRILPAWRDTDTLFSQMTRAGNFAESPPQQAHIYKKWAIHLGEQGRGAEAEAKFREAMNVYLRTMRAAIDEADYMRAIALSRTMEVNLGITPELRRERSVWLFRIGRVEESRADLAIALKGLGDDSRAAALADEIRQAEKPRGGGR